VNMLALGGITEHNIRKLRLLHIEGFGGISIFKKKTGLKKAGFFLNMLIPPKPLIYNNLSLRILFSEIPPNAKIFILFMRDK